MEINGRHYSWTQPCCDDDWIEHHPGREPTRIKPEFADEETCCYCGQVTVSGIYVRVNPHEVPHPSEEIAE